MSLGEFLDPPDEDNTYKPNFSDIILDVSGTSDQDNQADEEYIFGPPPDVLSDAKDISLMHDLAEWAEHKKGVTEEHIRRIEALISDFTKLQLDGRKQRTLQEMGFLPK
ncbi:hypothetical protein N7490_006306 [Penicillium lividum]|nr:hypothetical protein N7490_006306 [Penicillium lividum]